jgi:ABC-2 type transport system permease protein
MTVAIAHTGAIAARHVRAFARQPWWIAISLMQPVIYLVLFSQLFRSMADLPAFGGRSYLDFLLPGIVVVSALYSGGWAGTASIDDMERGVLDRLLVTPVRRAAVLLGHLGQQALIVVIQAAVLLALGIVIGARFDGGLAGVAVMLGAAVLLGSAVGALSHAVALLSRAQETLIAVSQGIILPMTFLSTTFMVAGLMPDWMATVAGANPLTWAVEASREALTRAPDWSFVASRIAALLGFLGVGLTAALAAFGRYRRAI